VREITSAVEDGTTFGSADPAEPHQIAERHQVFAVEIYAVSGEIHDGAHRCRQPESPDLKQVTGLDDNLAHGDGDERGGANPRGDVGAELMDAGWPVANAIDPGRAPLLGDEPAGTVRAKARARGRGPSIWSIGLKHESTA